jgi:hypothetical protein
MRMSHNQNLPRRQGVHPKGAVFPAPVADALARPLRDLRISVTDRCQFRCTYRMPREVFGRGFVFLRRDLERLIACWPSSAASRTSP